MTVLSLVMTLMTSPVFADKGENLMRTQAKQRRLKILQLRILSSQHRQQQQPKRQ